jgi:hypothetical protein
VIWIVYGRIFVKRVGCTTFFHQRKKNRIKQHATDSKIMVVLEIEQYFFTSYLNHYTFLYFFILQ